ncbi:NEW3 domain-containing protein [Brevibacillus daliensis]|uniref:NEW3 domain-containing protein n=1 Tax=Brevibacillus daliensis TaxID=2892995 RepID=UPI001E2DD99E|nr:NEW3 domain-containing protein [Brevibacillus daliensis]
MSKRKSRSKWISATVSTALVTSLLIPLTISPTPAHADRGTVDLWKSILPLTTIASAMNTGAHPDDEHSATLAYLALGKGVNTSSLIANRGEGGQNEIGSELGNALGIIRTRELQEASKVTNVHLFNLSQEINDPIFDFGFSKSPDETLKKWGEDVAYERLIRHIREQRPDVIIPAFLNEDSTHGHHRAINIMTVRAYADAADPTVFPEHAKEGIAPWQIKKLYEPADEKDNTLAVPTGDYDQIYGASYRQLGEESRFMHKSQGMGRHYDEGPSYAYYKLKSNSETPKKEKDMFDGIAFTFEDLAKQVEKEKDGKRVAKELMSLQKEADEVIAAYPTFSNVAKEVHEMIEEVDEAKKITESSTISEEWKTDILHRLKVKEEQLNKASVEALSLVVKVKPESNELIAGQTTKMTVTAYNGGNVDIKSAKLNLALPEGWIARAKGPTTFSKLGYNQTISTTYDVMIPADAKLFHPYQDSPVKANIEYRAYQTEATVEVKPDNAIGVLPPFSLTLNPSATVLNTEQAEKPIPVTVTVRNYAPNKVSPVISLNLPEGWKAEPSSHKLTFAAKGESKSVSFQVTAAKDVQNGKYTILAKAATGDLISEKNVQVIKYPHIGTNYYVQPAALNIQGFDLKVKENLKVGYVSSGFDNIDQYLRQLGVNVVNLDAKAIESGNLDQYDTIVLGIRAYAFRPELIPSNKRLLEYVNNGGNLVVQYHKPEDKWSPDLAPYPIKIGAPLIKYRVTDENSKVTMLAPDHPLFNTPNKITDKDWDGWIQDRSAYNPAEWGKEYTELISNGDAGEKEFTGTFLSAPYGKGTYTYSSLVWYREIPELVPGSIRMFVNMISLGQ